MTITQQVVKLDGIRFSDAGSTTPPLNLPLLDGLSSIGWAFSARRLATAYTGHIMKLRRAVDNAERDFDASANMAAEIASWSLGGDVFVSIWYDQSGNGRHAAQPTTALQPSICVAGTVSTINGIPVVRFSGGSSARQVLVGASADLYGAGGASVVAVTGLHTGQLAVLGMERGAGTSQFVYGQQATSYTLTGAVRNEAGTFELAAGTVNEDPDAFPAATASRFVVRDTGTVWKKRVRGTDLADVAYTRAGAHSFTQHYIGAPSTTGTGWSGAIGELIGARKVWSADELSLIAASQNSAYGL
ncbi:arabinofuranosidase catalytic domain-containing protein [Herbiconiux sp. KACC 21604]|uniref:arabinofuranosidase catalytic domain-containing protein n=1 Tax=unclassified Herbiconiux TaxID=2618217 RepID=UPI0014921D78|nr:arabinofuranosidase catalytic domain-containing protein [Herbiconiux sp. SALV-R1]QJU54324.1 hypothetical protein HL652_12295 [Herbiconiux sp. SALV-R1]WPO85394.1 arabinofuranosidase catalytic domain-containing protein [Herbiconiux sp. KACC 21604]